MKTINSLFNRAQTSSEWDSLWQSPSSQGP